MDEAKVISEVNYLLEHLEGLLTQARRLPWGRQVMVDAEAIRTVVDQVRHALPEEVRQAAWIIQERDRIIQDAGREADQLMNSAVERAHALAGDSEVLKEAEARARDIVREAEQRAQEIHLGALSYADEVLAGLDDHIGKLQNSVRQDRQSLKPRTSA